MRRTILVAAAVSPLLVGLLVPAGATGRTSFAVARSHPGSLDATFGKDGVVVTGPGENAPEDIIGLDGYAIAVGSKIAVAGSIESDAGQSDLALVAYSLDGRRDPSFGDGGVAITDLGEFDRPVDVQLDAQGYVLVLVSVGGSSDTRGAVLARFTADGTLDAPFGEGGLVEVGTDLIPSRLVLQPDGKIVVAARSPVVLARYTAEGQPDPGFGENGRVETSLGTPNDWAISVAALPDGRLLAVARTAECRGSSYWVECDSHLALVRYLQDGSLDPSFGEDGIVLRHIREYSDVLDGQVTSDGKGVVLVSNGGSSSFCSDSYRGQALWRFEPDGQLDTTFGRNGHAPAGAVNVRRIALRSDGGILVVGEGCRGRDVSRMPLAFALALYRPDGSLGESFGRDGVVVNLIRGRHAVPHDLVLQSGDRLLVIGNTAHRLAVVRYIV